MPRRDPRPYTPSPAVAAAIPDASGNGINGLGEREPRRASPMFWHPSDQHPFGALQAVAGASCRVTEEARDAFAAAYDHPPLEPIAPDRATRSPEAWTTLARDFALANEADLFGATPLKEHHVVEGYAIEEPNVIILGVSHDYERLRQLPSTPDNGAGIAEVGRQYARGTRTAFALANWIRRQGFSAHAYPGPRASALLLIPPAIEAGLGELGKHGSLINRTYGSNLRLAGVTTDMPLAFGRSETFGADDFCTHCRVCADACPPGAIGDSKQWVRGVERWYVDFDTCIPYFADNAGCGLCIAVCPWARPGIADGLLAKMARRRAASGDG
ncbi:4Fe-4S dicluster domain-containing protein [Sphingosinicella sp. BN140058]|uniref:4Fe-4S dicluster domain-containing protein n=1 Tax=Sphingosinicella sp. BN140058 TaxID=1892855 RepID=UPI001013A21E|nr:4Fe-4S dicluster domain-containing protein [Sphingosinicella sp. BN140058]QAY78278.1 4Fe-4S dicluster domain-containing protein [Sphingosinicella sp. BN140058]